MLAPQASVHKIFLLFSILQGMEFITSPRNCSKIEDCAHMSKDVGMDAGYHKDIRSQIKLFMRNPYE
jgi:hypothetical protein